MLLAVLLGGFFKPDASLATIQELARNRDVAGLEAMASPELAGKFRFLQQSGAFGVGRSGWEAKLLTSPDEKSEYIVFTTALTTQDYGDQIFTYQNGRLTKYVDEQETRGVRINHIDMALSFDLPSKHAKISAKTHFQASPASDASFFVRLGDNYKVSSVISQDGSAVKYSQAGGVLSLPKPSADFTYTIHYAGEVNRPRFAGAIVDDEVMLTNDYWWPSIGRLPATFTTKSTVPTDWTVVAQGDLQAEAPTANQKTVIYKMDLPVSYLSYSAGPFKKKSLKKGDRTYWVWSKEMTDDELTQQLDMTWPVIEFFDGIHPYPFKQYGSMVTSLYGGGALEAYSYSTYGTGWLPDEDAHEPSHTWFGGILANTYLNSFWNESFAVFCEGLYAREGAIGNKEEKRQAFVSVPRPNPAYSRAASYDTGAMAGGIASSLGYGMGAYVLQQLEYEMGRESMKKAMQAWLATGANGDQANWDGFIKACGPEWTKFFDQWLKRAGWPEFEITNVQYSNGAVTGKVQFNGNPYDLALETLVRTKGQDRYEKVWIRPDATTKTATFRIPAATKPDLVSFDPFDRLLGPEKPNLPERYNSSSRRARVYVHPDASDWWTGRQRPTTDLPTDIENTILVGHPDKIAALKSLLAKTEVKVNGNTLTYKGTSIPLTQGAAVGWVEYEPGKWAGFQIGQTKRTPNTGLAQIALVDEYGRFLRGKTQPRTSGPMVFNVSG